MISDQKSHNFIALCKKAEPQSISFRIWNEIEIHHFRIDHNAPCLQPKLCITIVSSFSWV